MRSFLGLVEAAGKQTPHSGKKNKTKHRISKCF